MSDCKHKSIYQVSILKSGKILMRCTQCPHLFVKDNPAAKAREPTPEDFRPLTSKVKTDE